MTKVNITCKMFAFFMAKLYYKKVYKGDKNGKKICLLI